jgi:hypothetical protein
MVPHTLDTALWRDCLENYGDWAAKTIRKIIIAGGAGWVDPQMVERHQHYVWLASSIISPNSAELNKNHRHSYMEAKANLEEAIPQEVFRYMVEQGYPAIGWDGEKTDLCSLIVVVENFMIAVVKVGVA